MVHLESLEVDLNELSAIDAAAAARRARANPVGFRTPLADAWDQLSVRTGLPALEFYEMDAAYDAAADLEESEAQRFAQRFAAVAGQLRGLFPEVDAFRAQHSVALDAALALRDAVPELIRTATTTLKEAGLALAAGSAAGMEDPSARTAHARASTDLGAARAAADERRWVEAHAAATRARGDAGTALELASTLEARGAQVRNGFLSVRTRCDALRNQQGRLDDAMSQLRRRYTLPTWRHVEDAPAVVTASLRRVEDDLVALDRLLAARPLVVPDAADLLAAVRTSVTEADRRLRAAVDLLAHLDEVSRNPDQTLADLQRRLVDTRRFVAGRSAQEATRMSPTLDKLAARAESLRSAIGEDRPDWGAVLAEKESIEAAIDAMIRNARNG